MTKRGKEKKTRIEEGRGRKDGKSDGEGEERYGRIEKMRRVMEMEKSKRHRCRLITSSVMAHLSK